MKTDQMLSFYLGFGANENQKNRMNRKESKGCSSNRAAYVLHLDHCTNTFISWCNNDVMKNWLYGKVFSPKVSYCAESSVFVFTPDHSETAGLSRLSLFPSGVFAWNVTIPLDTREGLALLSAPHCLIRGSFRRIRVSKWRRPFRALSSH